MKTLLNCIALDCEQTEEEGRVEEEAWVLTEEEAKKVEATYNELMRKAAVHRRNKKIKERGFDKENAFKVRQQLGLASYSQFVEKKRLCFAASAMVKVPEKKVCRVMEEEEEEGGEWWKTLENDLRKYKIESKNNLKSLFTSGKLKEMIESEFKLQDIIEKATLSEAQPEIAVGPDCTYK